MIHSKSILLTATILALSTTTSFAEGHDDSHMPNMYLGAFGGISVLADGDITLPFDDSIGYSEFLEYDTGYSLGINAGAYINKYLRIQGDLGYLNSEVSLKEFEAASADVSAFYGTLSLFFDAPINDQFIPFLGVGAGIVNASLGDFKYGGGVSGDDSDGPEEFFDRIDIDDSLIPILKLSAGASYALSEKLTITGGYDFIQSADFDVSLPSEGEKIETDITAHLFNIGLRYSF